MVWAKQLKVATSQTQYSLKFPQKRIDFFQFEKSPLLLQWQFLSGDSVLQCSLVIEITHFKRASELPESKKVIIYNFPRLDLK